MADKETKETRAAKKVKWKWKYATRPPDKAWFERAFEDQNVSMRQVSQAMGLGFDGLHKRLSGTRATRPSEARHLAEIIGQPQDEVERRLGFPKDDSPAKPVELAGVADASGLIAKAPRGSRPVDRPWGLGAAGVAVRVQALSSPLDGWVAFYVPSTDVSTDAVGRLSVSELADGSRYLRILQRGYDRGRWNLHALADGPALENVDVRWAAPVSFIAC